MFKKTQSCCTSVGKKLPGVDGSFLGSGLLAEKERVFQPGYERQKISVCLEMRFPSHCTQTSHRYTVKGF